MEQKINFLYFVFNSLKITEYKVKSNYPYSGAMIPNSFINKQNPKLKSVMIEINKELYENSIASFYKVQQDINNLLKIIATLNFN